MLFASRDVKANSREKGGRRGKGVLRMELGGTCLFLDW